MISLRQRRLCTPYFIMNRSSYLYLCITFNFYIILLSRHQFKVYRYACRYRFNLPRLGIRGGQKVNTENRRNDKTFGTTEVNSRLIKGINIYLER